MAAVRPLSADLFDDIAAQCEVPPESWVLGNLDASAGGPHSPDGLVLFSAPRIKALKSLSRREGAVWYVTVLPLRCWIRLREDSEYPARPLVIVVASVSPKGSGRLLAARLCDPPEQVPTTFAIMDAFFGAVAEEPPEGGARYLPERVLFEDAAVAARSAASLRVAGVVAAGAAAAPPPGVLLLREELSKRMVQVW